MRGFGIGRLAVLLAAGLALADCANADIYVYRDARGVLHFTNAPAEPRYRFYRSEKESWRAARWTSWGRRYADPNRYKAYETIVREAAERHQVDVALVKAVIRAESDFVPDAVSPKGALGLMQLMPATARRHGVFRVFDPRENIDGGVRHLRYLLDRFNGNLRLALAAYNAGEAAVDRHGGVPPYPETWEYVARVLSFRDRYLRDRYAQRN
ncbi:MAG: lytic transglycosylase [Candidatus Binatia bacterium]|nr:MAG: lytic transglycosylase [Candidatus Binatia bacterium]